VAKNVGLSAGERVFKIGRLRLADGEPLFLETIYTPERLCEGLTAEELGLAPPLLLQDITYTSNDRPLVLSKAIITLHPLPFIWPSK
jgi:DNA-binding GntR family transcriptional regulator